MSKQEFDNLLMLVEPLISKQHTKLREPVSAEERLMITLRYLATGIIQCNVIHINNVSSVFHA